MDVDLLERPGVVPCDNSGLGCLASPGQRSFAWAGTVRDLDARQPGTFALRRRRLSSDLPIVVLDKSGLGGVLGAHPGGTGFLFRSIQCFITVRLRV